MVPEGQLRFVPRRILAAIHAAGKTRVFFRELPQLVDFVPIIEPADDEEPVALVVGKLVRCEVRIGHGPALPLVVSDSLLL